MAKADNITAYRRCVGALLLNPQGLVWIGHRFDKSNEEGPGQWWQMPQGGIDKGEGPRESVLRELAEETSITSAEVIAESPRWYKYDLPEHLIGQAWKGKYRGQMQKWFALRFSGEESEINLKPPGHSQEFDHWRWARMDEVVALIVPFKRSVYEKVIADFQHLGA